MDINAILRTIVDMYLPEEERHYEESESTDHEDHIVGRLRALDKALNTHLFVALDAEDTALFVGGAMHLLHTIAFDEPGPNDNHVYTLDGIRFLSIPESLGTEFERTFEYTLSTLPLPEISAIDAGLGRTK